MDIDSDSIMLLMIAVLMMSILLVEFLNYRNIIKYNNFSSKGEEFSYIKEVEEFLPDPIDEIKEKMLMIEYSDKVLEYIQDMVNIISTMKFDEFINKHSREAITETSVKNLISEISNEVNSSIASGNIDFNKTIIAGAYYSDFIVKITIYKVSVLIRKTFDDEGGF